MIDKISLKNYKQFCGDISIDFNSNKNIFIGENGSGKTSLLQAIDLVLSGSRSKVEKYTLESLFNQQSIIDFLESDKKYDDLPKLLIEIYISNSYEDYRINGVHNSLKQPLNGVYMRIRPDDDFSKSIKDVIKQENCNVFPFEFYTIEFKTFADISYNNYNKQIKHIYIDNSLVNSDYALKYYIKNTYLNSVNHLDRAIINNEYRDSCNIFNTELHEKHSNLNTKDMKIVLNSKGEHSFEDNITITKNNIYIEDIGKGEAMFINTEYSLRNTPPDLKIILLEEPENHLSYVNMHKLISIINDKSDKQLFITTHNNMISSRLDLNNAVFLKNSRHTALNDLNNDTVKFFCKSPNNNVLNFILSSKAILVEGDAEYILLECLYNKEHKTTMFNDDIIMISCNGKTFKRYLDIAKLLNMKVAVITDNDKDYDTNIVNNYSEYTQNENIKIFYDNNNNNYTFEVSLYNCNKDFYETKIKNKNMTNGVLPFMLNNKAEAAYRTLIELDNEKIEFKTPKYISEAFKWIRT